MTRQQAIRSAAIAGAVVLAMVVLVCIRRRQADTPAVPAWLDTVQPPDTVAADLMTLTPDQSWAANRCRPIHAACSDYTAGRRIRRTYPPSLADSPHSFIRTSLQLEGGI